MTPWLAVAAIIALAILYLWPSKSGAWDEYGDGFLYTYIAHDGRTLGEVYSEPGGWVAHIYGESRTTHVTLEEALKYVETNT